MTSALKIVGTLSLKNAGELQKIFFDSASTQCSTSQPAQSTGLRSSGLGLVKSNVGGDGGKAPLAHQKEAGDFGGKSPVGLGVALSGDDLDSDLPFLQRVKVATIPTFELFVFALDKKFVVVNVVENKSLEKPISMNDFVNKDLEDSVTSLACWPVAPSRLTDPRPYEWTAIVIGLKDGSLLFFTDRGYLLMKQQYSGTKIVQIRIESDDLTVLYEDCYVVVNGLTLISALKLNRQKVARGGHSGFFEEDAEILWQKYSLEGVSSLSSVASTGVHKQPTWDQLTTASLSGGFGAQIGASGRLPFDTFCALGANTQNSKDPFVSFNWHSESMRSGGDIVRETLNSVTNRISFHLPSFGWLDKKSANQDADKARQLANRRATKIFQRSTLMDFGRKGETIVVSPNGGRLALICDASARVILLDVRKRVAVRVWKGYRDAQCGWLEVTGDYFSKDHQSQRGDRISPSSNSRRTVLCVVIFAPKRGILEIWSSQNGRRVAACNVDKEGLLLNCPLTSAGHANNTDPRKPVRFIDSSLNLHIPSVTFEAAIEKRLTNTYWSAETKDNFFTWWSSAMKLTESEMTNYLLILLPSMKSVQDLRFLLDYVLKANFVSYKTAAKLIESMLERMETFTVVESLPAAKNWSSPPAALSTSSSMENRVFYYYCMLLRQTINFYAVVLKFSAKLFEKDDLDDDLSSLTFQNLAKDLSVDETFLLMLCEHLNENIQLRDNVEHPTVLQPGRAAMTLSQFVQCMDLNVPRPFFGNLPSALGQSGGNNEDNCETLPLKFNAKLDDQVVVTLGHFLYTPFLTKLPSVSFKRDLQPLLGVEPEQWISILCRFWLDGRRSYSVYPRQLFDLIHSVLSGCNETALEKCLTKARDGIMESSRVPESLSLCLVLRAIAKNLQKSRRKSLDDDEEGWEKIDMRVEEWDLLLKLLHARLLTDTFLRLLSADKVEIKPLQPIASLNGVLSYGYGFVAEEIAKRLMQDCSHLTPSRLISIFGDQNNSPKISKNKDKRVDESVMACLAVLKRFFTASSLSPIALATNCCWEHIRKWHGNVMDVEALLRSVEFMRLINNVYVRRGINALIWHKFLRDYAERLCLTLDECSGGSAGVRDIGERFETKTQIPRRYLTRFTRVLVEICRSMYVDNNAGDGDATASSISPSATKLKFEYEDFIVEFFQIFSKKQTPKNALMVVAADQHPSNKHRALLHFQLSVIMAFIVDHYGALSETSPYGLFTEDEEELLFENLQTESDDESESSCSSSTCSKDEPANNSDDDGSAGDRKTKALNIRRASRRRSRDEIDKRLQTRRLYFLKSWVTALLSSKDASMTNASHSQTNTNQSGESGNHVTSHESSSSSRDRVLLFELCTRWRLNVDELRRHEIATLFSTNRAQEALKLTSTVEDRRQLAKDLMDQVCKSICAQTRKSKIRPTLTSRLGEYLRRFDDSAAAAAENRRSQSKIALPLMSFNACQEAMQFVSQATPRKSEHFNIAIDLRTVLDNFKQSGAVF